jgi:hypothetical protein
MACVSTNYEYEFKRGGYIVKIQSIHKGQELPYSSFSNVLSILGKSVMLNEGRSQNRECEPDKRKRS